MATTLSTEPLVTLTLVSLLLAALSPDPAVAPPQALWQVDLGAPIRSTPLVTGDIVIAGTDSGAVVAINQMTGAVVWRAQVGGGVASEPAAAGGLVFVTDFGGGLTALDLASGQRRWSLRVGDSSFVDRAGHPGRSRFDPWDYFSASPLVDGDLVIAGAPDGQVVAARIGDGRVVWRARTGAPVRDRPAAAGGLVVVGSFDGTVTAFDRATGAQRWRFKTRGNPDFPHGEVQGSPAVVDGDVVFGSRDYRLYRLDGRTGAVRWVFEEPSWIIARPVLAGGSLYVGASDSHMVYALDPATGERRWAHEVGINVFGSVALWDDLIVVPTMEGYTKEDKGNLIALDRATGAERWRIKTAGNVRSTPVVSGDVLLAGADGGILSAWRLSGS